MIDGINSEWAPVTSGVPQCSFLVQYCSLFTSMMLTYDAIFSLVNSAAYTKIGYLVPSDRLQKYLNEMSAWSERWEMPFNIDKCQVYKV